MIETFIKDIEYYLPSKVLTNEELVRDFPEWNAEKVAKKTGIKERHIAAEGETSADMAYMAASKLFERNSQLKKTVDFILFCTQTPDYRMPASACLLQRRLGLPTTIGAVDIDLGCSGFIYGLALAKGLVTGGIAHQVLFLTADTLTKHIHPQDKGNKAILGDAATATVISSEGIAKIGNFVLGTDGNGEEIINIKIGGTRQPLPINDEVIDDNGHIKSSDYFYMDGPEVFNFTLDSVPPLLDECLQKNNLVICSSAADCIGVRPLSYREAGQIIRQPGSCQQSCYNYHVLADPVCHIRDHRDISGKTEYRDTGSAAVC